MYFTRPRAAGPTVPTLVRAAVVAALTLPVALPASAAPMSLSQLPAGARFAQAPAKGVTAAQIFHKLHAHRGRAKAAHFSFPYGVAVDPAGNVFVANVDSNSVATITPTYKVTANAITNGLTYPISVAVGPDESIYVGSAGASSGYITQFSGSTPQQTITQNAFAPYSIAVDQFADLYIVAGGGVAIDDSNGNQIFAPGYTGYDVDSIALGNASLYAFLDNTWLQGNGSYMLRTGGLQDEVGPTGSAYPAGAACGNGACWYGDADYDTLAVSNGGNFHSVQLNYSPAGVAYDQLHNRAFVADPVNNAVHVYNAQTLAFEKTLT